MSRYAARVGATLPAGAELLGPAVAQALDAELVDEPHGPIEIRVFAGARAQVAMEDIGLTPDSPARAFLVGHPDGVLVVAMAEVQA